MIIYKSEGEGLGVVFCEEVGDDEGVVFLAVAGGVKEGDDGMLFEAFDEVGPGGVGGDFSFVALLEVGPSGIGIVVKPMAELIARSYLFVPCVIMKRFMRKAARPEFVNIHAIAFITGGRVIRPE